MKNILFIGAGSMAEAIIHGLTAQNVIDAAHIFVTNKSNEAKLQQLHEAYGVSTTYELATALQQADLVVLAMKPKDVTAALTQLAAHIPATTPMLSVVAGYAMASIEQLVGARPLARIMPNTSAQIALSTTGVAYNAAVDDATKEVITTLLQSIGTVIEVEEDQLHAVTAISGSGPAYFYYVVEAMEEAGLTYGLDEQTVKQLVVETMAGASEMLKRVDEEPHLLRKKITSPGGTTEAGVNALKKFHVKEAFTTCIADAEAKSRELANS